jgi:multidrug resistance efflux pump
VDIVAVAPGRIIVSDRTKVIQPLEASVVKKVLVKDGDRVQAGQVLVELDPTMATADIASVQEQLKTQASEAIRTRELLQMLSKQKLPAKAITLANGQFDPKEPGRRHCVARSHQHHYHHPNPNRRAGRKRLTQCRDAAGRRHPSPAPLRMARHQRQAGQA